jgi:16S rRNA (guanine527-N7)-methyltransferase
MNPQQDNHSELISNLASTATLPCPLSPGQISRLSSFVDIFVQWNVQYSFSRSVTPPEIIRNLVFPSVAFAKYFQPDSSVLDLGSGPGIPGIPLAIARPDLKVHLVESSEKPFHFIHASKTELEIDNVTAVNLRAEELAQDTKWRGEFDYVIARSFVPLPIVVETAAAFNKIGGYTVVQISNALADEIRSNPPDSTVTGLWFYDVSVVDLSIAGIEPISFASFVKEQTCPREYPRSWKKMKNQPLW